MVVIIFQSELQGRGQKCISFLFEFVVCLRKMGQGDFIIYQGQ